MTNSKDFLDKLVDVVIDRPLGSRHSEKYPNHIYPVNYGYVPNTISGDNEELDCYILGIFEPLETFRGKCIAIIHRTNDNDDKLMIALSSNEVPENIFDKHIELDKYSDDYARLSKIAIEIATKIKEKI